MGRADEYLARAAEADRLAHGALGLQREQLEAVARQWRQLARDTGELSPDDPRLADPADDKSGRRR